VRIPGLDLLRAIAIVWVMFFHATILGLGTPWSDGTRFGWMGVDLFFVLSGYLIGTQWLTSLREGSASFSAFYSRRAFRIFPAYAVTVVAYFAWPTLRERPAIQPLWQFVTFTENLFITLDSPKAFSHVWSLCVEEHFYVAFPLLTLLLWRRPSMRLTVSTLVTVLVFGMLWRARAWFGSVEFAEDQGVAYYEQIYYPTLPRLDGLLAGVSLALVQVFRAEWWARLMARPLIIFIAGLVCFAASIVVFDADPSAGSVVFGFPLVSLTMACFVAACVSPSAIVQRVPIPGVATIAALSYSLYLSHKFSLHVAAANGFDGFVGLSVATLLAGAALHFGVERPFLKLRERLRSSPLAARARIAAT
jgi:peptidoglycan/LPS O-acetylase OafA/YrhL